MIFAGICTNQKCFKSVEYDVGQDNAATPQYLNSIVFRFYGFNTHFFLDTFAPPRHLKIEIGHIAVWIT